MATTPEGKVKKKLKAMIESKQGVWSYPPQAGPFGSSGIPDRIACVRGRLIGIEAKADETKKPTALQYKCMADIEAAGGKCFVVYDDETIKIVEDWIDACR
tara:strand:+ start:11610 stop:11912 length:303 start_codon:yes stop_codon:yes gene_type:complete